MTEDKGRCETNPQSSPTLLHHAELNKTGTKEERGRPVSVSVLDQDLSLAV